MLPKVWWVLDPQTLQPIPALAESWDISADGKVYTFHLRKGVTFSDGSAFDANDVKYSFDRLANATTGTSYTAGLVLSTVAGWSDVRPPAPPKVGDGTPTPEPATPATSISGVKVIDPQTVEINADRATPVIPRSSHAARWFHRLRGANRFHEWADCDGAVLGG